MDDVLFSIDWGFRSDKADNPQSLFHLVTHFIVSQLESVESLVGIPELIGQHLFHHYWKRLIQNSLRPRASQVKLFVDAFGDEMASQLNLSDSLLLIDEFSDIFKILLAKLKRLDLSDNSMGDDHELMELLPSLECLEFLDLSKNSLTDKTLRRLTLNSRKGPAHLARIDLSFNERISLRGLIKLKRFKNLQELEITGIDNIDLDELGKILDMEIVDKKSDLQIENKGWCCQMIEELIKYIQRRHKEKMASIITKGLWKRRQRFDVLPKRVYSVEKPIILKRISMEKSVIESVGKIKTTSERANDYAELIEIYKIN